MKLGINQAELSRISGVKPPTICRIEKGITEEVNTDTLKALAIALDTSTDWLLGLT